MLSKLKAWKLFKAVFLQTIKSFLNFKKMEIYLHIFFDISNKFQTSKETKKRFWKKLSIANKN